MEHNMFVHIDTEDGQDSFQESIPITEEEYQYIHEKDWYVFPKRVRDEISRRYPGRGYSDESYILDDKLFIGI